MLTEAVAVAAVLVVTLYLYLTWNYRYWSKKGITQVEPVLPGIGNLLDAVLLRKAVNVIHNEIYRKFPHLPAVGFYQFRQPALLIRDPEIIQTVLVTNFSKFHDNDFKINEKLEPLTVGSPFFSQGAKWKENRSAMAPGFTTGRVKSVYPKMQELCERLVQYLDKHTGEDIETKELAYLFTTDAVSNCAFGVASNSLAGEESLFLKYGKMLVSEGLENGLMLLALFFMPTVSKLLRLRFTPPKVSNFVEELVNTVIDYRKKNNITQNDFIQALLKNRKKNLSEAKPDDKAAQERSKTELLSHCLSFFMEGFETSTVTISFTMYELAKNIDVQQRLREELENATCDGQPLDYDTLIRLPYLDKVISETLRKYPVMSSMIRLCTEETTLEVSGKSVKVDVGTPIVIPLAALHNNSKHFLNPEKFDPERFSEENISLRHRYCYLPFGEGPRICVGMRFGLAQVKAFIATTVLNCDIMRCDKTVDTVEFNKKTLLLVSNHGLWMLTEAVAVAAVLVVTLYLYLTWNYRHWSKKGITQAEPVLPGIGHVLDAVLLRKVPHVIHNEIYKKFPHLPAVGIYQFRQPALVLRDPELIQTVLVTNFSKFHDNDFKVNEKLEPMTMGSPFFSEGANWKENRSALAPGFTTGRVKSVYPKMQEMCERLVQYLDKHTGEDIEARQLAYLFTTDAVSNCAFGVASNALSGEETLFLKYGKMLVSEGLENGFLLLVLFFMPTVSNLLRLRFIPPKVSDFVEELVNTVIDYRQKNNVVQNDFIQVLLKNREKALSEAKPGDKAAQERIKMDLLSHSLTFFMEGFETSTNIISFTVFELAKNVDVQQRLREELENATCDGKPLDYDTLMRLPYLDKVISETIRKYPVMWSMIRLCTEETTLEVKGKPVKVDVGTPIIIPLAELQNDPKHFPNPEKFDPERFSEENISQRHRYCYLPFGEGPRICIGMRFGLAQVKAFIATTVLNYDIMTCDKTVNTVKFNKKVLLLVTDHGLWVRLKKRHRSSGSISSM